MKYVLMICLAVVNVFMHLIAPVLVLLVLPFAEKVGPGILTQRYKLPALFHWLETPDELLPGDLKIPAVGDIYRKWGWFICSWYWLGFRNVAFGISWQFGKPATNYLAVLTDEEKKNQGVFESAYRLGFIKVLVGYAIYKDWYSTKTEYGFWAVPRITIRFIY